MKPQTELQRVREYARDMKVDLEDAVLMYGQLRELNRRRAYERTCEYIYLRKVNKDD